MKTSSIQGRAMSCIIQEFRWMEHNVLLWHADLKWWGLGGGGGSYWSYGGIHPGVVQRDTLAEESVRWHVGVKSSWCPLTKLFKHCSMAAFYESKQMFTFGHPPAPILWRNRQAPNGLPAKRNEGMQSFGELEFPGPKYLNKLFFPL